MASTVYEREISVTSSVHVSMGPNHVISGVNMGLTRTSDVVTIIISFQNPTTKIYVEVYKNAAHLIKSQMG